MSGVGCCYIHIAAQNIFLFPSFHLSWWYDSISIKRRMRGVNLGRKMIILIHVTILWWIFFCNLLSNYVHQLVMHLALMPLENFLHITYPIQWHLYMQLCTMSNNIQNKMTWFLCYPLIQWMIFNRFKRFCALLEASNTTFYSKNKLRCRFHLNNHRKAIFVVLQDIQLVRKN